MRRIELSLEEQRVIGCLIEKSLTTPDQYPLSLNALTNACNQKSNREPVLNLTENEVQNTVDKLIEEHLVMTQAGHHSRVAKYLHRFCNTEFSDLQFTPQELGIICVLFLRGPQTPGELRTRTNRLCQFSNVNETETVLQSMIERAEPWVVQLNRVPGQSALRYQHCFGAESISANNSEAALANNPETEYHHTEKTTAISNLKNDELGYSSNDRLTELEEKIELMQLEIDDLKERLENK